MNKNFYIVYLFVFVTGLYAQPTIQPSDLPAAGDQWIDYGDYRQGVHTLPSLGPNQTWDYSKEFMVSDTALTKIVAPAAVPAFLKPGSFPNANLATYSVVDSTASYFLKNNTGLYIDGVYSATAGGIDKIDYSPDALVIPVPFTYNNTRNGTARLLILTKVDTINAKLTIFSNINVTAPAYGSLKTPAGQYTNTLLIKRRMENTDSVYFDLFGNGSYFLVNTSRDTSIDFYWLRSGNTRLQLMNLSTDALGTSSAGAQYADFSVTAVNDKVQESSHQEVYPNPAASGSIISIRIAEVNAHELSITDLNGKVIRKERVSGFDKVLFNTIGMMPGYYMYMVTAQDGSVLNNGRFVIQ
ncbi:MAG: T9SS type A sorting domain-containing protein [Saprospiraceae bacterium]|nr:T9SS type A sorting domain-containing protein [Saprospiraceae bacterium]HMW39986.1 T9SS type A sorting domain-containing protein [Saprospiraceae bacterium]HMX89231.1 T9SS type A sorting domain-containing protein [Saprospiraceae bacterium]HMZ40290.1 T9SS type A sorting domain-containing protein [Saprospiraceae bacterium]HNB29746.1 T9SS type A sorting domain-containing protein [Saprospiraceae bacterium]